MKPQFFFNKEKFQALEFSKQHKKCAEFLRELYSNPEKNILAQEYMNLLEWMELPLKDILLADNKSISDRYHWHLEQAGITLKEHSFLLPTTQDRIEAQSFLPISIYLDHLRSCHNIGSILRTTEAFRLGNVFFSEGMADSSHRQVQNTSMGTYEWVSCSQIASPSSLPGPIIALETIPNSIPYSSFQFPDRFTLAVGNEEYGCSDELLASADSFIHIPLYGRKNSLNVATAFAIVAAEIIRQKR